MKKLLFMAFAIAANSFAAVVPYEVILNQGNAAGTSYSIRYLPAPPSNSFMVYDLPNNLPKWMGFGSFQADWNAVSGYGAILNKPSSFPPANHSHTVSDVTGLQSQIDSKISSGASIPYSSITGAPSQFSGSYTDLTNKPVLFDGTYTALTGKPTLFSGAYSSLTGTPTSFSPSAHTQAFSTITATPTTRAGYGITDAESLGAAATAQAFSIQRVNQTGTQLASTISDFTTAADARVSAGVAGKENAITAGTTAQYWRGDKTWQTLPSVAARSFAYQTRALNTCFQVSSTRDALVSYTVEIATSISLSGGSTGTVYLRTYTNSTCSLGTQELTRLSNGQSGSLTIGLNITQTVSLNISGIAPAGTWLQLVTENNTGMPIFMARPGQETLL